MTTLLATHPLAVACRSAHPWTDATEQAQREGEALDARVTALALVVASSPEVEAELRSLASAISAAEGRERSGGQGSAQAWAWRTTAIGVIRATAVRLGLDPEALDLR